MTVNSVDPAASALQEPSALKGTSLAKSLRRRSVRYDAWLRFRRNPLAVTGTCYIVLLLCIAIAAPLIAPHNPVQSDVRTAGSYRQAAWIDDPNPMRAGTWEYPLGTDSIGRDVLSRLIYGARVSMLVAILPTIAILLVGIPLGLVSGYAGGPVDNVLMRITDIIYAFPALLFFIVIQVALIDSWLGAWWNGLLLLLISLSILSWAGIARLVRGDVLALKGREFVIASRASGATTRRIVGRHVLPNALGPVIVAAAFLAPGGIVAEAVLGYLGIGIRPDIRLDSPLPSSWGTMIFDGYRAWQSQPWMLITPTIAIAATTLAFTFVGDGIRDALDVREGS